MKVEFMKLDRNTNPDGTGKYALIQMREATFDEKNQIRQSAGTPKTVILSGKCIRTGAESPGDQFFVIKYKDRFAAAALHAYSKAVFDYAFALPEGEEKEALIEYRDEMIKEALRCESLGNQTPT